MQREARDETPTTTGAVTKFRSVRPRRALLGAGALAAAAAMVLAGCTSGGVSSVAGDPTSGVGNQVGTGSGSSSSAPAAPVVLTSSLTTGAKTVNPAAPVTVHAAHGTLSTVVMTNAQGTHVTGELSSDATSWHTTEDLGYSKTYKIVARGKNADGKSTTMRSRFTTLTPGNMTLPYMQRTGAYPLGRGETYGVGIVPIIHFDEPIAYRKQAEKYLDVRTSPHVDGAWYWADDQDVQFRPQHYWAAGTKVVIAANVYGAKLGPGLYGQSDVQTNFTIGRRQVTTTRDVAPAGVNHVIVRNAAGKVLRTMNTSMGEHTGETVNGQYINFYTLNGNYTVIAHENPAHMCSDSYGLPANAPGGYGCENIYWSSKISVDGIYLHELDTTTWAQDSGQDVSHGCLNLNESNAQWFYTHSMIGDPVEIQGAKGAPTLQVWQGGAWTVPWSTWAKGGDV